MASASTTVDAVRIVARLWSSPVTVTRKYVRYAPTVVVATLENTKNAPTRRSGSGTSRWVSASRTAPPSTPLRGEPGNGVRGALPGEQPDPQPEKQNGEQRQVGHEHPGAAQSLAGDGDAQTEGHQDGRGHTTCVTPVSRFRAPGAASATTAWATGTSQPMAIPSSTTPPVKV